MNVIEELISVFQKKYNNPLSLKEILQQKYGKINTEPQYEELAVKSPIFTWDRNYNLSKLKEMIRKEETLEVNIMSACNNDSMVQKVISSYKKEVEGLISKLEKSVGSMSGEKLAGQFVKSLQKTLMKLWHIERYKQCSLDYLQSLGIILEEYDPGHKMTDDEIAMLDGNLMEINMVETTDKENNYVVIEMLQPVLHIGYIEEEDDDIEYADICGVCKFYYFVG